MINYLIGIVFLVLFTFFLYYLGKNVLPKLGERGFSMNLLIGYTTYTFIQAIGGIIVQIFQLDWFIFFWYMIITLILQLGYIVYKEKKEGFKPFDFKLHLKNYWFIYVISGILLGFSLLNFEWQWLFNSLDDGRYLTLVSTFPYTKNPHMVNPSTGLPDVFIFVRVLNTFELEYSFWVYLLKIDPTIFTRFVMNIFNYYLTLHAVYAFSKIIFTSVKSKIKEENIQFIVSPILFFAFYFSWQIQYNILQMQDAWQFSTAMWYGSSIVRITGAFLCIVPVLKQEKITGSVFAYCFMVSVVLMSKATQALPMLIILAVGYLIALCLTSKNKKYWILAILMMISLLFVPKIPSNFDEITAAVYNIININSKYILWYFSFVMLFISFFFKNKEVNKWGIILIVFALMMWVPQLNNIFVDSSMYAFVAARTTTLFIFTIVMSAFVYLFVLAEKIIHNPKVIAYSFLALGIALTSFMTYEYKTTIGLRRGIATLVKSPYLMPQGTYELSHKLEDLSLELGEELNVLSQNALGSNGFIHSLSISLRLYAPDINSISAVPRYSSMDENSPFINFTQEDQWIFESFNTHPDDKESVEEFKKLLDRYPINCVVAVTEGSKNKLIEMGFKEYDRVEVKTDAFTHYILYK